MSLETWKQAFYPVPAHKVTPEQAVEHSIQKWTGLKRKNLEGHGVRRSGGFLYDEDYTLPINGATCALCVHYLHGLDSPCANCPLYKVRGNTRCDDHDFSLDRIRPPYQDWYHSGNPERMLYWLERAKELEQSATSK